MKIAKEIAGYFIIYLFLLLFTVPAFSHCEPCPPCYTGAHLFNCIGCTYRGCPSCDTNKCLYCNPLCQCLSWLSEDQVCCGDGHACHTYTGETCCPGEPTYHCCPLGATCCGDHCCGGGYTCCEHGCCNTSQCQKCDGEGGTCTYCSGNLDMSCCNGTCYDPETQQCCHGNVIEKDQTCCEDGHGCDEGQTCCGSNCCDPASCETCINGQCEVCGGNSEGCESFDQQHCVEGECEQCLYKVSTYAELESCNKVDDPCDEPTPNGCGPGGDDGISDDPANCSYPDFSSFKAPCDHHDLCYSSCVMSQSYCDSAFGSEMDVTCQNTSPLCYIVCEAQRVIYWAAVAIVGRTYYEAAQVAACACCDCE